MSVSLQQQPAELRFIAASQPDIIRSAQKVMHVEMLSCMSSADMAHLAMALSQDDLYVQQTIEACHDLVRRVAGAYPALQYARYVWAISNELLFSRCHPLFMRVTTLDTTEKQGWQQNCSTMGLPLVLGCRPLARSTAA